APPAIKKAKARKSKPQLTPAPTKKTLFSKRDYCIIVHRETFRELVEETRLKEIHALINMAIQQANRTSNKLKLSGVTINKKKNYILLTFGYTPTSEILKYRANMGLSMQNRQISSPY